MRPFPLAILLPALASLLAALLVGGCERPGGRVGEAKKDEGERHGVAALLDEVARARFTPPRDGRLTERQVEMYIEVERQTGELRRQALAAATASRPAASQPAAAGSAKPAKDDLFAAFRNLRSASSTGNAGDTGDLELRAANELKLNLKEFAWVRERVLEARMAAATLQLERRLSTGREQYLALLERQRQSAQDEVQRADLAEQIADFRRRTRRAVPRVTEPVQKNIELLTRYEDRLVQVQTPAERFSLPQAKVGGRR
ncbi:MAG TPA: hypothetical protein VMM92_01295 [Thermoanaerobaculia bacterium]|nr:hypothetical protein [Thermoanaerobaculia bacterium]